MEINPTQLEDIKSLLVAHYPKVMQDLTAGQRERTADYVVEILVNNHSIFGAYPVSDIPS